MINLKIDTIVIMVITGFLMFSLINDVNVKNKGIRQANIVKETTIDTIQQTLEVADSMLTKILINKTKKDTVIKIDTVSIKTVIVKEKPVYLTKKIKPIDVLNEKIVKETDTVFIPDTLYLKLKDTVYIDTPTKKRINIFNKIFKSND